MATKKLQKYCRIFQWVEVKDDALAGAIRDLCMEGALSGGRRSGATFLFPSTGVRKEIVKKAYSADAEQAIRLLDAHIIPDSVRTAADFKRGVGSRLGIKLEVESASGSAVTLKGGAKLKPASDFHPLRKDNIAVWEVESGEVPLEGPAFEAPKRGRGEYHGGNADPSGNGALNSRQVLASTVENDYDKCMRSDRCRTKDPYLAHSVSLLNFLKGNHPNVLVAVLPMIDRDPAVTFYLLVEPYKTEGSDYVLSDDILFGPSGWNGAEVFEGAVSEFQGFFDSLGSQSAPSAEDQSSGNPVVPYVFKDAGFVRSGIDNVRLQIVGEDGRKANKIATPKLVHQVYESLIAQNAIGGAQPILPDDTIRLLPGSKKLWQDELRFVLHAALMEMRGQPSYQTAQFAEIVRMVRFSRPGNDYSSEAQLSNVELLQQNVSAQAEFSLLIKFINSTDFLYVPVPSEKVGGAWGDIPTTVSLYDPRDLSVYNAEASKQRLLEGYKATGMDAPRQLDAGTIAAIRHYVALHGSLPPGLGIVEAVTAPQGK
jgi:hypothetical protein